MNIQISSPVTWQRWSVCWPRGRDEILKLGVSTGMGPPSVGPLGFWLKIESRVAAPTMQVHFCILKIAITIHFVWRPPEKMDLSLVDADIFIGRENLTDFRISMISVLPPVFYLKFRTGTCEIGYWYLGTGKWNYMYCKDVLRKICINHTLS